MSPKDVYVVYNQLADEIVSVHSLQTYATLARRDLVNDVLNRLRAASAFELSEEDVHKVQMRYVVDTLEKAIVWMTVPFKN